MAFVVEDGSGLSTATSYVSVADADTYFTDAGGNATWTAATTDEKQGALVQATRYIDAQTFFSGSTTSGTQALEWPRYNVVDRNGWAVDDDSVPQKVKDLCCEFAVRALDGSLIEDKTKSVIEESVEGAVTVKYVPNSPDKTRYDDLWRLIDGLTSGSSIMGVTIRS